MRRPSLLRIVRFALLTLFIIDAFVVAVSSSLASDAAIVGSPGWRAPRDAAASIVTDGDGALLTPAACKGSLLVLTPGTPAQLLVSDYMPVQRSVFVTAIKDFSVCSMGCRLQVTSLPQTLNAYIYAANGTTRGALLASGSVAMSETGNVMHFVTVNYTLKACHDYELVFAMPANDLWEWWNDTDFTPFDRGVIRVRDGAANGDASNGALLHFELVGSGVSQSATLSDFGGPGVAPNTKANDFEERGIYVHMLRTGWLSSFGFEANLVAGQTLTARVYSATGTTRGAQLASGTYAVAGSGLQWHDVSVNCELVEGRDYDIAITFGDSNSWPWWSETTLTEPYSINAFQVVTSELAGAGTNTVLPHYRARWEDNPGGAAFHLAKLGYPDPPPLTMSYPYEDYGAFVTMLAKEEVYGIGWKADIPAGQEITASIYDATGNVRVYPPIATATIASNAGGMRWHDIPLAVTLQSGTDYDIAISWQLVNEVRYWADLMGLPYTSYGVIQVRNGEHVGDANSTVLIDMRLHMCNGTLTAVTDRPARTPMFIAAPAPNPVSGVSRLDFSLGEAGPVSIRVYDVAGRLVSTVLESSRPEGWSHAELAATNLPSGVYFLKMETPAGSLARKFVVTH